MYRFVKFSDLGPFTDIVHSNDRFSNVPTGMLLDLEGRIVGHGRAPLSTRRFGTFEGTAGQDMNEEPPPSYGEAMGGDTKTGGEALLFDIPESDEEGLGEFGFDEDIIDEIVREELAKRSVRRRARGILQSAARSIGAIRRGAKRLSKAAKKKAVKKAALAGIRASNKGDDNKAARKAMVEAKEAGLSPGEVKAVGRATKRKVKKHMEMEDQEAGVIAGEVAGSFEESEPEGKHSAGVKRGRPAGSKKGTSSNPLLNMKSQKQLKAIGKSMGFKPSQFKNRSQSIDSITTAASESRTPIGLVIEAAEGKLSMPTPVLQAVQVMEDDRRARGRSKKARGTSAVRRKTRQPRSSSPVGFISQSSVRGRLSQAREKKKQAREKKKKEEERKGGSKY